MSTDRPQAPIPGGSVRLAALRAYYDDPTTDLSDEIARARWEDPDTGPPVPHRWAINEDPDAPNVHTTSSGHPDHCLVCGVARYPLAAWAQELAAGPCPGPPRSTTGEPR